MAIQHYISRISDLVIPLLLYFVWNWDLHFILLFSYLDLIVGIFMNYFKERRIKQYKKLKQPFAKRRAFQYFTLGLLGIIFFELAITQIYPSLNLWSSFINFLMLEEMGVPQFVLVFPLVILLNYQQYQSLFIKTKVYSFYPLNYLENTNKKNYQLYALSGLLIFGMSFLFPSTPLLSLFLILGLKFLTDFVMIPFLNRKFIKQFVHL
jgi:NADH:ubiquinone oxidoreductase subunit 2 (subunit N)